MSRCLNEVSQNPGLSTFSFLKTKTLPRIGMSFRDEILVLRCTRALGVPASNAVMGLKKRTVARYRAAAKCPEIKWKGQKKMRNEPFTVGSLTRMPHAN